MAPKPGRGRRAQFQMPKMPAGQWCIARRLREDGLTLQQIGDRFGCDPRTAKACILRNSDELDRRNTPGVIAPYEDFLLKALASGIVEAGQSVRAMTQTLYRLLRERTDYPGGERTLRAYLSGLPLDELLPRTPPVSLAPDDPVPLEDPADFPDGHPTGPSPPA